MLKMTASEQKNLLIKILFYAVVLGGAYALLKVAAGPLLPLLLAGGIAVCLQGVINRLCAKFRFKKGFAAVSVVIAVYTVVGVLAVWLVRALYRQLTELVAALPRYSESISQSFSALLQKINHFFGKMPDIGSDMFEDIPTAALTAVAEKAASFLTDFAAKFAQGVPNFLLSLAVTITLSAYFAKDYTKITEFISKRIPEKIIEKAVFIKNNLLKKLGKLLRGYLTIMVLTFFELLIGLKILGVKYALIISVVTAVVDILPVLGSGTVLVPWAVGSALTGNPSRAVGLIVLYIMITIVRNVSEPKIIGDKLGVHPVLMLASVFLGLRIFGGAGVIIAPIAVIIAKSVLETKLKKEQPDKIEKSP